ncbi:MAG: hypothetical protein WA783_14485 [Phormidesmis sp.]
MKQESPTIPVGLGGERQALEQQIGLHTVLATERGTGGDIPGIVGTSELPGVTFRFSKSDRANYCKLLQHPSGAVHLALRDLRLPQAQQLVQVVAFVERDRLKAVFSDAIAFPLR